MGRGWEWGDGKGNRRLGWGMGSGSMRVRVGLDHINVKGLGLGLSNFRSLVQHECPMLLHSQSCHHRFCMHGQLLECAERIRPANEYTYRKSPKPPPVCRIPHW
ncbi:hypothetical protein Salat_1443200 [Sesamum alatum]|uniref:Uncharacterized protein n=1 Tax=Sesamum alatum TaxID=300844 RepID=A0AAE1YAP5_9LAMI|nr:hypothetical protein Salat_1443200 [Sesamum alatum]